MDKIEQTNKMKILEELQKNGRASASDIAEKTGLSRQTVAKIISNMEKNKEIWGYTAIFDPKLVDKKPFLVLGKVDFSLNSEELLKKVTSFKLIDEHEKKYGFKTSMYLNGPSDIMILLWAKDTIEAKKFINNYKKLFSENVKVVDLYEGMATFRNNGIVNPKIVEEWNNLLI
jgi:DNA-binding Lrp family transcriptional regulator